jgi:hypothetical protein
MTIPETCIFDPNSKYGIGIYSFVVPDRTPEVLVCMYGGQTLEELKAQGKVSPEAFVCPWEEASRLSEDLVRQKYCKGPSRVTEERWWELLEVLFPARWEHFEGAEIFMMPECITSTFYIFGVRIGEDYFSITEDKDIPVEKLVAMCSEFASSELASLSLSKEVK